jgi:hypothetical protein
MNYSTILYHRPREKGICSLVAVTTTNISIAFHWLDTISIFGQSCKTSHWPIKDVEAIQKKGNPVYILMIINTWT